MISTNLRRDRGATAIFVVMFASLLFLVMTVGFIRLMVQEQTRSTDSELSRSAYDAALSGVEDGKRVLAYCLSNTADTRCDAIKSGTSSCNTVQNILNIGEPDEVPLVTQSLSPDGADTFDQAYTCVKISSESPDYSAQIPAEPYHDVVRMKGVRNYTKIRLSWFSQENVKNSNSTADLHYSSDMSLPDLDAWAKVQGGRPQMLRATYIPDASGAIHDSEDKTLYLFPYAKSLVPLENKFSLDTRRTGSASNLVRASDCIKSFTDSIAGYACSTTMEIPSPTSSSYLYLASPYGAVDYKVELLDSNNAVVNFDGVQPTIDSTGRAGDVFRRVRAAVEQSTGPDARNLYPRASIDITNNFCKNFAVGTVASVYDLTSDECNPTKAGN